MTEFKCINCGEIKDSENICSCPKCGYRMFELPYERREKIIEEIKRFISALEVTEVKRDDLDFEGKGKDDNRFPDYDKILKYVSSRDRTEDFLNNLLETTEQLKLHFTSEFSKDYPVSFERLENKIASFEPTLYEAGKILSPDKSVEFPKFNWEKVTLLYTECQNKFLWFSANELIGLIEKLAEKIIRFIKVNNLYGNAHKYYPAKIRFKEKNIDFKDKLENAISETEAVLAKKFYVDIMDDGTKELKEMLTCLWHDIELIMRSPLFVKNYDYYLNSGKVSEDSLLNIISEKISERYNEYNQAVDASAWSKNKSDDELFEIYKKLIAVDEFGILVPNGTNLINIGESEKKLDELVGLSEIKESIKKIKAYALANKNSRDLNIHMCFLGNPGSGKTEVARYIVDILYENGILPTNRMIEVDRNGLVSQYYGATAEKASRVIESALGGVLFVDEAYSLINPDASQSDYGKEAVDTLVKAMEDYRGKFCVILAGYKNEMLKMLSSNPGFNSRIQFMLDFPNYSRDELKDIANLMLGQRQYSIGDEAMSRILDITDIKRKEPNFANARELRNILDQVIMCQYLRCLGSDDHEIGLVDVNKYIGDAKLNLPTSDGKKEGSVLTGEEELDRLIGLATVKRMIKKIKAYAKRNKDNDGFNLHMCFYGNPGTGKTEVARILSRILYDADVLGEAKLVETDAHGLLGRCVGETAPKTEAKINEAMNGVLFIDEAYRLSGSAESGSSANYGEEAISVLLKEMEDHRGQFCVILAGYRDEMRDMLKLNPGFESRVQFNLEFPDYNRDELREISKCFLSKRKYEIKENALELLLDITEYYRSKPNFANARTVRNIVDQVIMNQNLRTEDSTDDNVIIVDDVEDYLADENIDLENKKHTDSRIGFV